MNKVIGFILLFSVFFGVEAKSYSKYGKDADEIVSGAKELRINESLAIPTYIEFREDARPDFNDWINYFKSSFQLESDYSFELLSSSTDKMGNSHYRYVQTYNGVAIELAHFIVHTIGNKVKSMNGVAFKQQNMTKSATVSFLDGLNISTATMGASVYKWESVEEENHLKLEEGNPNATYYPTGELVYIHRNGDINSNQIRLTRKYNVYAIDPLGRIEYYIDALNGEVIFEHELIHTTNKPGVANTGYSGTRNIVADSIGDNLFRLRETTRGNGISTFDMNKSTQHSQGVDFIDSNNVWSNFNADLDQYAGDAHWGAEVMYDYLDVIHQRNSIDGNGFALLSYVHYGNQYNNAFWDGQRMTYGDGNAGNTPLTSIDIAGHEIAHGLTNFTAGLLYRSESGALNESFSDIFGAAVENHGRPTNWNWFMGEDIGSAFRNMSNPNQFGHPDTYGGVNWINQNCTPTRNNDWCGVHTNSGVQNYWFYLLTQGGNGVNDIGDTFSVAGLGIVPAAEIAFRNLTVYLGPNSNHDDARFYAIKSAIDLHGGCSYEVEQVTNAWYAVGVGGAYTPGVDADFVATYDTVYCAVPALVDFTSNSNNVSTFKWLFGDGDSSNLPKPSHLYTNPGLYSVSLYVDGGVCGADSLLKTGYINIDTNNFCSYAMDRNTTLVINDCDGRLYDNGGLNGDYELQSYDTVLIEPSGNVDFIYLLIDSLNIEAGYGNYCNHDYLEVFDGGSTDARSLGRFCSANLPPDTIMSSSPKLTIVLSSDDLVQRFGFVAEWFCQTASQAPIANFSVEFDSTCNGFNSFKDLSSNGVNSWMWDFGDGNTSTEQNPVHIYEANGVYNVSLTVSNSVGNDIKTKMAAVVVNRPIAPAVLNDTNCVNANFKLAATGSGTLNWYTDLLNDQLAFVGDTFRLDTIKSDTSFYVSSFIQQARVIGTSFAINGTGANSDTTAELYFDVMKPTLLESVIIKSIRRGDRVVDLKNSRGEIIDSRVVNVPNVPSQVQLNFEIPPGTGYSLSIANRNPSAYVNYTGAIYPYNFGSFMTLTGSSLGSSAYPFFYYMIARELPCLSPRVEVSAIVDTSCIITSIADIQQNKNTTEVYPNPFRESFVISRTSTKKYDYELLDLVGKIYAKKENVNVQQEQVSLVGVPKGIYLLKITEGESSTIQKLVKH